MRSWGCDCLFGDILKTLYFQMMFMHLVSYTKRLGQVVVFFFCTFLFVLSCFVAGM